MDFLLRSIAFIESRVIFLSTSESSIWLSIKILGKIGIECRFIENFENDDEDVGASIRFVLVEFYRVK